MDLFRIIDELETVAPEWAEIINNALDEGRVVHIIDNRTCDKVKYGHKETAETAAAAMRGKTGSCYDSYECDFCDAWHIGHAR